MNNLPKVVTQQRRGRDSNPRLLDRKSDALPLSHRATRYKMGSESLFIYCYQLISTPGHPNGSEKHGVGELWGGVQINHTWPVA